ncbi:MAG: SGNH/GDSL hydrolase family protein [Candidatus Buchananbacteria bacterium]
MKKGLIIILSILVIIVFGIYLNRSYAHFYSYLGDNAMINPNISNIYRIDNSESTSTLTYVVLGDSLSSGVGCDDYKLSFPYQFAESLSKEKKQNIILVNVSKPGAQSADLFDQIGSIPRPLVSPDIVTLFIGTNDIHNFVSSRKFQKNLNETIARLKQSNAEIIVVNIPYLGSSKLLWWPYNWYFAVKTLQYNKVIDKTCKQNDLKCFDVYQVNKLGSKDLKDFYSADLFHPSCAGYSLWTDKFYANIR